MPPASRRAVRFVRALLPAGVARCGADGVFRTGPAPGASLEAVTVAELIGHGVLAGDRDQCCPGPDVRTWLRRQLLGGETPLAAQHRLEVTEATGVVRNLAESPLSRLATTQSGAGGPFLAPHQVEAGERLRQLVERAQLRARVTMSYDPTRTPGAPGTAAELGDFAADARRTLASVMQQLPADCADVVLDVCGLEKGLQQIEQERGWPRRSAKLVLRIGLEQLARQFGLSPLAVGNDGGRARNWMGQGARPEMFAGD